MCNYAVKLDGFQLSGFQQSQKQSKSLDCNEQRDRSEIDLS
jgi:hypothetical protein